jgi:predicted ATPase
VTTSSASRPVAADGTRESRWFVLTGAPGAGKTTTIEALRRQGIPTVPEAARALLEEAAASGRDAAAARADERLFQDRVLESKLRTEAECDPSTLTVFDRGIPDTLAYYRLYGWEPSRLLRKALDEASYACAFVLEPLPLVGDDPLRIESPAQQQQLVELLLAVYREHGTPIVEVAPMSLEQRAAFLLEHLASL